MFSSRLTASFLAPKMNDKREQIRDRAMSHQAPHGERNRQILAAIGRAYIESGEPVSSRSISRRHVESLSPATIRNVMADLEEEGFLYQPHTSAGRVPTASGYRFFAQQVAAQPTLTPDNPPSIHATSPSPNP